MNIHHALSYVEFGATDMAATKAFYAAVFGWEFTDYGPEYAAFKDLGGNEGGFSAELKTGSNPLVILYSKDLEATKNVIQEQGGKIVRDTFSFPGGRRFHFTDPNGNELAVWSE